MSRRDPGVTLRQILVHARRLQELTATSSLPAITQDWKLAAAFEREMEILGEAVKRLPATLLAQHPGVPWKQIAGTRDRLSHGYDETDHAILWDAAQNDLAPLIAAVEEMLRALGQTDDSR
jgi:uncharacterized protein with HEPN domain